MKYYEKHFFPSRRKGEHNSMCQTQSDTNPLRSSITCPKPITGGTGWGCGMCVSGIVWVYTNAYQTQSNPFTDMQISPLSI